MLARLSRLASLAHVPFAVPAPEAVLFAELPAAHDARPAQHDVQKRRERGQPEGAHSLPRRSPYDSHSADDEQYGDYVQPSGREREERGRDCLREVVRALQRGVRAQVLAVQHDEEAGELEQRQGHGQVRRPQHGPVREADSRESVAESPAPGPVGWRRGGLVGDQTHPTHMCEQRGGGRKEGEGGEGSFAHALAAGPISKGR